MKKYKKKIASKETVQADILPPADLWDKTYPIFSQQDDDGLVSHYVFISTYFESPDTFSEVVALLDTVPEGDRIIFKINSGGGRLDAVQMLIDSIRNSKAEVIADLSGTVASAATMFTLACDDIYIAPHTEFMVHNFSGGSGGKGNEISSHIEFMIPNTRVFYQDIYQDFMTPKEIRKVIKGEDYWFNSKQVTERWNRVQEARQEAQLKAEKKAQKQQQKMLIGLVEDLGYTVKKSKADS